VDDFVLMNLFATPRHSSISLMSALVTLLYFYFRSFFFACFYFDLSGEYLNVIVCVVSYDAFVAQAVDVILDAEVVWVKEPNAIASDCDTAAWISSLSFFLDQWFIANNRFRLGAGGPNTISFIGNLIGMGASSVFIIY